VFVSFDAHSDDLSKIGIPTKSVGEFQQIVANLTIATNIDDGDRLTPGTFEEGNIEFWGWNYTTGNNASVPNADDGIYDFGDQRSTNGGYGSFQVHNHELSQVVFAYNRWGDVDNASDLGIGNNLDGQHLDFTFQQNVLDAEVRNLFVFVGSAMSSPPFQITDLSLNEAGDQVTLTWNARPGATYLAESSVDMQAWVELGDGIDEDTLTIPVPAGAKALYYRVEEE
jgi:hypothetical protein